MLYYLFYRVKFSVSPKMQRTFQNSSKNNLRGKGSSFVEPKFCSIKMFTISQCGTVNAFINQLALLNTALEDILIGSSSSLWSYIKVSVHISFYTNTSYPMRELLNKIIGASSFLFKGKRVNIKQKPLYLEETHSK